MGISQSGAWCQRIPLIWSTGDPGGRDAHLKGQRLGEGVGDDSFFVGSPPISTFHL